MSETPQKGGPLKRLDFQTGIFTANGKEYTIESYLSIERYCEFQALEKELCLGLDLPELIKKHRDIYNDLNKQKLADACVKLENIIRGVTKIGEREPAVLKICALFINTADEDRRFFSADMITQKISDWKAEGIAINDFFKVALNSVSGFLEIWNQISQAISEKGNETSVLSAIV